MTRALAVTLAGAVAGWQVWNAARGAFLHRYLAADLLLAAWLAGAAATRDDRRASVAMLAGFAGLGAVFFAAATGGLLGDGVNPGTVMAALGVVPCAVGAIRAARRLTPGSDGR